MGKACSELGWRKDVSFGLTMCYNFPILCPALETFRQCKTLFLTKIDNIETTRRSKFRSAILYIMKEETKYCEFWTKRMNESIRLHPFLNDIGMKGLLRTKRWKKFECNMNSDEPITIWADYEKYSGPIFHYVRIKMCIM